MVRFIFSLFVFLNASFLWANANGVSMSEGRLEGRVALVTGAAQGIGKEVARVLAREGAYVIIADIKDDEGRLVVKEIGDSSFYIHMDVRSEHDWQMAMKQIMDKYSKLDILVNNAGIQGAVDPENGSLEKWKEIQAVDIEGVFLGCK